MRILMFIPSLMAGGAERVMSTLSNYLIKNNEITIITLNNIPPFYKLDKRIVIKSIESRSRKNGILGSFMFLRTELERRRGFIKEVKQYMPDVILSFLSTTNIIAISAIRKLSNIPLVISERNDPRLYNVLLRKLISSLYPRASLIICQGKKVGNFFQNLHGKTCIIPNPLNNEAIGVYHNERKKVISTVGRLIPAKNHMLLINAFADIASDYQDYTVEIYGDGELKQELQEHIDSLDLTDRIKLMGTRKGVMHYIDSSCCFVLPSNFEGFPNVLIEAMASGLPVISTNFPTGIAEELIKNDQNGYVIPVNDRDELVSALKKLLDSKELQNKMGLENMKITELYSEEQICRKWEKTLYGVINKGSK